MDFRACGQAAFRKAAQGQLVVECKRRPEIGYFDDAELGGVITAFPPREAAHTLINRARDRGKGEGDNVSVAVLKLIEVPAKKK